MIFSRYRIRVVKEIEFTSRNRIMIATDMIYSDQEGKKIKTIDRKEKTIL
jgi:hypothetical protein